MIQRRRAFVAGFIGNQGDGVAVTQAFLRQAHTGCSKRSSNRRSKVSTGSGRLNR